MALYLRTHHAKEVAHLDKREEALNVLSSAISMAEGGGRSPLARTQVREPDPSAPPDKPAFRQTFDAWFDTIVSPPRPLETKAAADVDDDVVERARQLVGEAVERAAYG